MRKLLVPLVAAALSVAACQSGQEDNVNPPPTSASTSASAAFNKPLQDILVEAGFSPKEFTVDQTGTRAAIQVPPTPCVVTVTAWQEDTYMIEKIGDRVLGDLAASLNTALRDPNVPAQTVEQVVTQAYRSGKLTC